MSRVERKLPVYAQHAFSRVGGEKVAGVLLVCMPFQSLALSPLSIALLATTVRSVDVPCDEAYFHFELAKLMGRRAYRTLSESGARNMIRGEVLFAEHMYGASEDTDRLLTPVFGAVAQRTVMLDEFKQSCVARVVASRADVVGFSTSFNQLLPSLWLARALKERVPGIRIVFGGASCSAPMGQRISAHYRDVDLVISGFGETTLTDVALGHIDPAIRFLHNHVRVDLDALPIPDYQRFLGAWDAYRTGVDDDVMLSFESSRGCWWGEKNHCKFCGLNQVEMGFDAKSSQRVVDEIRTLWEQHRRRMFATDTILAREHLSEVMSRLAEFSDGPELFYEVKPNMRRAEVASLRSANVTAIQPGIESLSTRLLKLMRKGVRGIQNVALLKWCRELGIRPVWNLLYGIPGEAPHDYFAQIELAGRIPHLAPPEGAHRIQLDRYSPYFDQYAEHGWAGVQPLPEYRLLHPRVPEQEIGELAYHFDGVGAPFDVAPYEQALRDAVTRWETRHLAGDGVYWDANAGLLFSSGGTISTIDRDDVVERVIASTHEVQGIARVLAETRADLSTIEQLIDLGVLWREGEHLVNLVVTLPS